MGEGLADKAYHSSTFYGIITLQMREIHHFITFIYQNFMIHKRVFAILRTGDKGLFYHMVTCQSVATEA